MTLEERTKAFAELGEQLRNISEAQLDEWYFRATSFNNWFTRESVAESVSAIGHMLQPEKLEKWLSAYDFSNSQTKKVAVIMAGNIPLVGFHDFLSVLIAGHSIIAKLSSQDPYLIKEISRMLIEIEPGFEERIELTQEQVRGFDAVIATGSDNSARYFHQYFGKYPHIIRKNRTSVAVLTGDETEEEIQALGKDMFQYYGLGCRNVNKLLVPTAYDFQPLLRQLEHYEHLRDHHKWVNNYDYNKSIYLINGDEHFDSGAFLIKESEQWVSPITAIFYEFYEDQEALRSNLSQQADLLQCIVGSSSEYIPFGKAQEPELWDYADGVDTLEFLSKSI